MPWRFAQAFVGMRFVARAVHGRGQLPRLTRRHCRVPQDEVKTVTIVPMQYSGLYMANPGALFAILTIIALPLILLYVVVQRAFVRGLLAGAVKG